MKRMYGSLQVNRRHFLKDISDKALTVVPLYFSFRGVEQKPMTGVKTMSKEPSGAKKMIGDFAPKLVELTDDVLFGDVWERKELSKRDRSLVTVAALIALNRPDQLRFHLGRALENGLKKEELIEVITHLAFYSGWPNAMSAIMTAKEVFSK
jgi:4-carboxymuconolactone decarboxylase